MRLAILAALALTPLLSPAFAQSMSGEAPPASAADRPPETMHPDQVAMNAGADPSGFDTAFPRDPDSAVPGNWDEAVRDLPRIATRPPTPLGRPVSDGQMPPPAP